MAVGVAANVVVLKVADGEQVVRLQLPEPQSWHRLVFAADGKRLVWTGYEDKTIRTFDLNTGKQAREYQPPEGASVQCISPDATCVVYAGKRGHFDVYDIANNKLVVHIEDGDSYYPIFTPDSKRIAMRHTEGKTDAGPSVRFYDAATGKLVKTIRETDPRRKPSGFEFLAFSRDGGLMAAWGREPFFDVWDLASGKRVCSVRAGHWSHTGQFSCDGKSILCTSVSNSAVLHNILLEKVMYRFDAVPPYAAAMTPDEKRLVVLSGSSVRADYQYSLYLYDLPRDVLDPPSARAIDDVELTKLWVDLESDNDLRFQLAFKAFRSAARPALTIIRKEMPPVTRERQKQIEAWIAELDDENFKRRDAAMEKLQSAAHEFAPLLTARHKTAGPGEISNRLTFVLKQKDKEKTPMRLVRESRVVRLLEHLAMLDASEVLKELAGGAPDARLTHEARAALKRLSKAKKK